VTLQEVVTKYSFEVEDKALDVVEQKLTNLGKTVAVVGASVVAAAGTLFGFAKMTAAAGNEAAKMAQKIGIGVERLQELQFAAKLADVDAHSFANSLRFLNRNMVEAADGNRTTAFQFARLGVKIKDSNGKLLSTDNVLTQLADRFSRMPDGPQKTAAAMDLLGRSGADLIPLLNGGSKNLAELSARARELGVVLDADTAKASEEFNDALTEMFAALTGIRNIVGAKLIPIITRLAHRWTEFIVANRAMLAMKLERFFEVLITYIDRMVTLAGYLIESLSGLVHWFGGLERVVSMVVTAFAIFAGAKVLYGIGQLIGSIALLASKFTMLNAAALILPILIGAAAVVIGLMIEDFYQFMNGGQSVIGTFVEFFKLLFEQASAFFAQMGPWGQLLIRFLLTPIRAIVGAFQTLGSVMDALMGKKGWGDVLKTAANVGQNMLFGGGSEGSLSEAMGFSPSSAGTGPGSGNAMNQDVTIEQTISVGPGVDPIAVGQKVQTGTTSALDLSLRGAERMFPTGGY
jgi:hypothetical protein